MNIKIKLSPTSSVRRWRISKGLQKERLGSLYQHCSKGNRLAKRDWDVEDDGGCLFYADNRVVEDTASDNGVFTAYLWMQMRRIEKREEEERRKVAITVWKHLETLKVQFHTAKELSATTGMRGETADSSWAVLS